MINGFIQELYDKANVIGQDKKLLLARLKEAKSVLANKYLPYFRKVTFDFEHKRLVGDGYYIQWQNRGTNSVGQCSVYKISE